VRLRQRAQLRLLGGRNGLDGATGAAGAAELHLHEHERAVVLDSDQVDLPFAAADVALHDAIALVLQVIGGEALAGLTQAPRSVGHRSIIPSRPGEPGRTRAGECCCNPGAGAPHGGPAWHSPCSPPARTRGTVDPARTSSDLAPLSRSEEHTSELQSRENLVCRLLLEKKKMKEHYQMP